MKTTLILSALAAGVLTIAPVRNAAADDYKIYHGSGCKVFGATAWTDLHFAAAGISNLTNSAKNIICPLVKDNDAAWDGNAGVPVATASVHFHWRTGPVPSSLTCNVYTSDSEGTLLETTTYNSGPQGGGNTFNADIAGLDTFGSGNHAQAMMLCTLGPRASLQYYYLFEQGDTN